MNRVQYIYKGLVKSNISLNAGLTQKSLAIYKDIELKTKANN